MSTKFFNNVNNNTLFDKLKGIATAMPNFESFLAVAGFFRSSGYFKLRQELEKVPVIKILVGINVDDIFRRHNKTLLMLTDSQKTKDIYGRDFCDDVANAKYSPEVEKGILQMFDDLKSGKLELRIHPSKNLHAKFYLCLPSEHNENSDGWVIMGSSNISDSGLGVTPTPRYELNVAMKDYDDVKYCSDEFWRLWEESVPLTATDIEDFRKKTYLDYQPSPYELYIKVLIDTFGDQVEDDFFLQLPDGIKDLKYQKDAVIQGYRMLMQHNGLFLADVVGLGKTMIATMIAKRFIEANGKYTNVLVVFPPALESTWVKTFKLFGIYNKAQFITNGSLSKILNGKNQYKDKEEFDLIIVDEAHGFRNDDSGKYDELQRICKSPRTNVGFIRGSQKKVMLLSATPLNNRPDDLLNQLLLFQNSQSCTIDGIPNLNSFFSPLIAEYKKLMKERETCNVTEEVEEKVYKEIRVRVIDKVTVRRTRNNILNDPAYKADIDSQGIVFPHILPPNEIVYEMNSCMNELFYETLASLSDESHPEHLNYARYRAVEFLKPEFQKKYKRAEQIGKTLAGIYRVHMVKRLESSFYAFKKSLATLLRITKDMIKMFDENKVIIAPELNVRKLQANDMELDEIIEYAITKGYLEESIVFSADNFDPAFINMLHNDKLVLERLNELWTKEHEDPKFDKFRESLSTEFLNPQFNPSGKLVLFSESVDTLDYIYDRLIKELGRRDVLLVTAKNRNRLEQTIKENFDANFPTDAQKYNIIITSDVLAEGVNLHRSNVIVNYDSPWNATRLMQRIGRVNRIGSKAPNIYNYMFYPSQQGNREIQLYKNALVKLQGFHSAFGEDAQIYSREEIVKQFRLYDNTVKDSVDKKIALLREVRDLYNNDRELYHKIKELPMKSRVMRKNDKIQDKTIVFISSKAKTEFYLSTAAGTEVLDFLKAADYLKARPEEKAAPFTNEERHFEYVNNALEKYKSDYITAADNASVRVPGLDKLSLEATKFLRTIKRVFDYDSRLKDICDALIACIKAGMYARLPRLLRDLAREYKKDHTKIKQNEEQLKTKLHNLFNQYCNTNQVKEREAQDISNPQIIISETFI